MSQNHGGAFDSVSRGKPNPLHGARQEAELSAFFMQYKDSKPKYKLSSWIKHPVLIFQAWQRRNLPVIDLDNPENNCSWCGYDHHSHERYSEELTDKITSCA